MTNFRTILRHIFLLFLLLQTAGLYALSLSSFELEEDAEATITLCNKIKIVNIDVKNTVAGQVIIPPKDLGGYQNIRIISKGLDTAVKDCFNDKCSLGKTCDIKTEITRTIKVNEGKTLIVKTVFDGELEITFLVSKYKRGEKTVYRIKPPVDFKFLDKKLEVSVKKLLTQRAKEDL